METSFPSSAMMDLSIRSFLLPLEYICKNLTPSPGREKKKATGICRGSSAEHQVRSLTSMDSVKHFTKIMNTRVLLIFFLSVLILLQPRNFQLTFSRQIMSLNWVSRAFKIEINPTQNGMISDNGRNSIWTLPFPFFFSILNMLIMHISIKSFPHKYNCQPLTCPIKITM